MADRLDELVLAITGDVSGLGKATEAAQQQLGGLGKATQNVANQSSASAQQWTMDWGKVGANMSAIGKSATVGLTMPLAAAGVAAVNLASDMDETLNKVGVTFGENASAVEAWSSTSIESMGLAQQSAMDTAALYGDMGAGMGIAGEQGYYMATSLVQLSADMASFKNVSQERAATALAGIYTGETEALKGLGVVMTQANLQQFAATQGITKNISEMSQAEQVTLRYQYVMAQTANAQGDFARTGGGMANQSRMVKEQLKQLGVNIGQQLLPAATKLVQWANNMLAGWNKLDPGTRKIIVSVGAMAAAVGPVVSAGGKMITTYNNVKKALEGPKFGTYVAGLLGVTQAQTQSGVAANVSASAQTKQAAAASAAASAQTGLAGSAAAAAVSQTSAGVAAGAAATGETAAGVAAAGATPAVGALGVAFNALLGPVGLVIGVLGAVGVGAYNLMNSTDDAAESMDGLADSASGAAEVMGQYDTAMQATSAETLAAAEKVSAVQQAIDAVSFAPAAIELSQLTQSAIGNATQMADEVSRQFALLAVTGDSASRETRNQMVENLEGLRTEGVAAINNYAAEGMEVLTRNALAMGTAQGEGLTTMLDQLMTWGEGQRTELEGVCDELSAIWSGKNDDQYASEADKVARVQELLVQYYQIVGEMDREAADAQIALYNDVSSQTQALSAGQTAGLLQDAGLRRDAAHDEADAVLDSTSQMLSSLKERGAISEATYKAEMEQARQNTQHLMTEADKVHRNTVGAVQGLSSEAMGEWMAYLQSIEDEHVAHTNQMARIEQDKAERLSQLEADYQGFDLETNAFYLAEKKAIEDEYQEQAGLAAQQHADHLAGIQGSANDDILDLMDKFGLDLTGKTREQWEAAAEEMRLAGSGAYDAAYGMGKNWGEGIALGIESKLRRVRNAAGQVTAIISTTTRGQLQIGSPSRLGRKYTRWYDDGLILGLRDRQAAVAAAASRVTDGIDAATARLGDPISLGAVSLPAMPASPQPAAIGNLPSTGRAETVMVVDGQVFGRLVTGYADAGLDNIAANTDRLGVYIR